jgi:hypothetical protein
MGKRDCRWRGFCVEVRRTRQKRLRLGDKIELKARHLCSRNLGKK